MSDNDVIGAVRVVRHILAAERWAPFAEEIGIEFIEFADLGLHFTASDREV